jgi:Dolichyl-phosphate-mannose-protein mannosyltransferase
LASFDASQIPYSHSMGSTSPVNLTRFGTRVAPRFSSAVPVLLLFGGFWARVLLAGSTFLNPDEALHYLLSVQPSWQATYQATLTTAHPPLLIALLHGWQRLGHSELVLRLPSLLAGTAFCWIMFCWLDDVTDSLTALLGLALLSFAPSLIAASAEVRQYALLLFFEALCLYLLDGSIEQNRTPLMIGSMLSLYGALFTHYSALFFALTVSVYAVLRLRSSPVSKPILTAWTVGQVGTLAVFTFLYMTHLSALNSSALPERIAATWLHGSTFHPGQDRLISFLPTRTIRLFRYLFSHGTIGVLALLLFAVGIVELWREHQLNPEPGKPSPRQLALLLVLPLLTSWLLVIARVYPYGGTRHNLWLAGLVLAGVSSGIAGLGGRRKWLKLGGVLVALLISAVFPSATPPYIKTRDQKRRLMQEAVGFLRQAPSSSILLSDFEGSLLLTYYLCPDRAVQFRASEPFVKSPCGHWELITSSAAIWSFETEDFPATLEMIERRYELPPKTDIWLFQAGWIDKNHAQWVANLRKLGCSDPHNFGQNILVCQMILDANDEREVFSRAAGNRLDRARLIPKAPVQGTGDTTSRLPLVPETPRPAQSNRRAEKPSPWRLPSVRQTAGACGSAPWRGWCRQSASRWCHHRQG